MTEILERSNVAELAEPIEEHPAYQYIRASDNLPVTYPEDQTFAEIIAPVKLFHVDGPGTYWIIAYDPASRLVEVAGQLGDGPADVGGMHIDDLIGIRGALGLPFERDLGYKPVTVAEILAASRRGRQSPHVSVTVVTGPDDAENDAE